MFTNKRYITCRISRVIPNEIQSALWSMIDNLRASTDIEVDYLQVFRLSIQNGKQKIIHRQEEPVYRNEILVAFIWNPVENAKIFVIDDGAHSTMMLAEEYWGGDNNNQMGEINVMRVMGFIERLQTGELLAKH